MDYVKSLDFLGVKVRQRPCIVGDGVPTISTVGVVGEFYMDSRNGNVYKCTKATETAYTWEFMGGSDAQAVKFVAQELTDEEKTQARENIGAMPDTYIAPVTSVNGQTGDVNIANAIQLVENTDKENKVPLRSLASGTYVLKGYFTAFEGSTASYTFSTGMLVAVVVSGDITYVQIFYPKNNTIQYLEITDTDVSRQDAKLVNVESVTNMVTQVNEESDDSHYPSAKAVYDALSNVGGGASDAVQYVPQMLTEEQQMQVRENTGAASKKEVDELADTIGKVVVIPERIKEESLETDRTYCSDITPDTDVIVGSKVFGNALEGGYHEHYITQNDITEYEWGFDFTYGFVLNNAPATINDNTYETNGLYISSYCDYLDDRFSAIYASYGMEIYYKLDSRVMPLSLPSVPKAKVGQTIKVASVDENGKPTSWEVADLHPSFSLIGSGETKVSMSSDTEFDFRKFHEVVIIERLRGWTAPEPNAYTGHHAGTIYVCYVNETHKVYPIGMPIIAGTYEKVERIVRINMSCNKAFYTETLTIDGGTPTTMVGVSDEVNEDEPRLNCIVLYNVGYEYENCELEVYAR